LEVLSQRGFYNSNNRGVISILERATRGTKTMLEGLEIYFGKWEENQILA